MNWQEFEEKFPIELNQQQKKAVQKVDGPVLLLAVPGSGKTTVLVTRLGYMALCCGIPPENILTVTYTVAATKDMKHRCAAYFGKELAERFEFRTINGICAKIIQYYGRMTERPPFELIKDEKQITALLASIFQQTQQDYPTESDLKTVRTLITYIKNMMLTDAEIQELEKSLDDKLHIGKIYRQYYRNMRDSRWMDFDDQMIYAYNMLRKFPELLEHFQNQYPYICVDEAQDTSRIQHAIIRLLASKTENLFMVGDEDQSIYGFRAAYPQALLDFEKDHPGAEVLLMEQNFRSNGQIVKAADRFIQKNLFRHEKSMVPVREEKSPIREIAASGRAAQYQYLIKVAESCAGAGQEEQTAVLYRDNECALPLIDLLERQELPYRMRQMDMVFFSHRIVTDILNVFRLAVNPYDTEAFLQIYYKVGTYMKKADALHAVQISMERDLPVLDAAVEYGGLNGHAAGSTKSVRTHLKNMTIEQADKALYRITEYLGYREYLDRSGINGDNKLEILKILAGRETSPGAFLDRMDELKNLISGKASNTDSSFILSTIHASKGLEYDTVYLMDVIDGILPEKLPDNPKQAAYEWKQEAGNRNALDAKSSLKAELFVHRKSQAIQELEEYEEERRLFYVGATRAKNNLILFTTKRKSTFCEELLGKEKKKSGIGMESKLTGGRRENEVRSIRTYAAETDDDSLQNAKKCEELMVQLDIGVIVEHRRFGEGVVLDIDAGSRRIMVQFEDKIRMMDLAFSAANGLLKVSR